MFGFQPFATSNFFKESIDTQMSFLAAMSKSFFDTSIQLGEFSTQAIQNAMDASLANFRRSMQLTTASNTNPFASQPTQPPSPSAQLSILLPEAASMDTASAPSSASEPVIIVASDQSPAPAEPVARDSGHGTHETPPKPSPLVEKLIASVVETPNSGDKNPGGAGK